MAKRRWQYHRLTGPANLFRNGNGDKFYFAIDGNAFERNFETWIQLAKDYIPEEQAREVIAKWVKIET